MGLQDVLRDLRAPLALGGNVHSQVMTLESRVAGF